MTRATRWNAKKRTQTGHGPDRTRPAPLLLALSGARWCSGLHAQIPMRARVQRKWPRLRGWVPEHPRARARARCAESKRDN
eukprot:gene13475-biopygen3516